MPGSNSTYCELPVALKTGTPEPRLLPGSWDLLTVLPEG